MKLYRANLSCPDGVRVVWASSRLQTERDARAFVEECGDADGMTLLSVTPVNVPTSRPALVAWLNRHLSTDNG